MKARTFCHDYVVGVFMSESLRLGKGLLRDFTVEDEAYDFIDKLVDAVHRGDAVADYDESEGAL